MLPDCGYNMISCLPLPHSYGTGSPQTVSQNKPFFLPETPLARCLVTARCDQRTPPLGTNMLSTRFTCPKCATQLFQRYVWSSSQSTVEHVCRPPKKTPYLGLRDASMMKVLDIPSLKPEFSSTRTYMVERQNQLSQVLTSCPDLRMYDNSMF